METKVSIVTSDDLIEQQDSQSTHDHCDLEPSCIVNQQRLEGLRHNHSDTSDGGQEGSVQRRWHLISEHLKGTTCLNMAAFQGSYSLG